MSRQPFIVWKADYNTGIEILDRQYCCLASIINNFFDHRDEVNQNIYKNLVPTMEAFIVSTKVNFLTIEKLMKVSEYYKIENQIQINRQTLSNIIVTENRYRTTKDGGGMIQYLKEYWITTMNSKKEEHIAYLIRYFVWRKKIMTDTL